MPPHQHRADVFSADPPDKIVVRCGGHIFLVPMWFGQEMARDDEAKQMDASKLSAALAEAQDATRDVGIFMSQWVRVR